MLRSTLLALVASACAASGQETRREFADTAFEHTEPFATYVDDAGGRPNVIGVAIPDFDSGALTLQAGPGAPTSARLSFDVMHPEQDAVPFDHMQLDYNPFGHPGGFNETEQARILGLLRSGQTEAFQAAFIGNSPYFGVPHFDVHFQLQPDAEVESWQCPGNAGPTCPPGPPSSAPFFDFPAPGYMPDSFFPDVLAAVPAMGTHWEDKNLAATKANGLFLREPVFIHGTYGGKVAFWEIMVGTEALRAIRASGEAFVAPIALPRLYPRAGYWPTTYAVYFTGTEYRAELRDFEWRCAGECQLAGCGCAAASASSAGGLSATLSFREDTPCQ